MRIHRVDHIGITVQDLAAVKAFFVDLGLELLGEMELESKLADRVTGLENVRSLIAMLGIPGGGTNIELSQFLHPKDENGVQHMPSNALGIRHIAFAVEDIDSSSLGCAKRDSSLSARSKTTKGSTSSATSTARKESLLS